MSFALWNRKLEGTLDLEADLMWPTVPLHILSGRSPMENFLMGINQVRTVFLFSATPQGAEYWKEKGGRRNVTQLTEDELNWLKACLIEYHGYTKGRINELLSLA